MWVLVTEQTSAPLQVEGLRESAEAGAFWAAVVFPAAYLPLLVAGFESTERTVALAALAVIHLLLLSAGHAHRR